MNNHTVSLAQMEFQAMEDLAAGYQKTRQLSLRRLYRAKGGLCRCFPDRVLNRNLSTWRRRVDMALVMFLLGCTQCTAVHRPTLSELAALLFYPENLAILLLSRIDLKINIHTWSSTGATVPPSLLDVSKDLSSPAVTVRQGRDANVYKGKRRELNIPNPSNPSSAFSQKRKNPKKIALPLARTKHRQ